MSVFFKPSDKDLVKFRNDVFKERGVPGLANNRFSKSPFSTAWFGKDDAGGFIYEFCRLSDESRLELILVYINKGDPWVQLYLNVFKLDPPIERIEQLVGLNGLHFHLPPNAATLMRLRTPDGLIFSGAPKHKIGFYLTRAGLERRLRQLGDVIDRDMNNIDKFVVAWLEQHEPYVTDWQGRAKGKD